MCVKKLKIKMITVLLLISGVVGVALADPTVSADLTSTRYSIGDTVKLRINVAANSGIHGLYFDLGFDSNILAFQSLTEDSLPKSVNKFQPTASKLLYAVSDPASSASLGSHIMVSYALNDPNGLTLANGTLAELIFRVVGVPSGSNPINFSFKTTGSGAYGANQQPLNNINFVDSAALTILAGTGFYVHITAPLNNQAVYQDQIGLSAISTAGTGYTYKILNEDAGYESIPINASSGSLTNFQVPVSFGFSRVKIQLLDSTATVIATDSLLVFRSQDEVFVKIISPLDHALVNTDMVTFLITSPLDAVTVNGLNADKLSEKSNGKNLFSIRLWLKKGFNEVTARATGPQGQLFANTITVFYQKDESVFQFVDPLANIVVKPSQSDPSLVNGSLKIRGEISSAFKSADIPNTVTLRVVFRPKNPALSTRILVQDRLLPITESTIATGQSQAAYMFSNDFPIPLTDLTTGELELIAYKNKSGSGTDAEIHRIIFVNNNQLSINLVQPNILGTDVLDTPSKVKNFNGNVDPAWGDVKLLKNGSISLAPVARQVQSLPIFANKTIADLIETKDGTRYALINDNNVMRIYSRNPKTATWTEAIASRDDIHGYSLCETDIGILVGASNLFSSNNSGLYILQNGALKNITIGQPIPHVQFIQNKNGTIYLYGNDYSHLYSFNIFSLEDTGSQFKTGTLQKIPFDNDLFIRQFVLSDDARTALILTNDNSLLVYQNLYGTSFTPVSFEETSLPVGARFSTIVRGEYSLGSYNAYLLVAKNGGSSSAQVLMENKASHRLILTTQLEGINIDGQNLVGVTFKNDRFVFLYKAPGATSGFDYQAKRGNILFNQLVFDPPQDNADTPFNFSQDLTPGSNSLHGLLASDDGSLTLGFNSDFAVPTLYEFFNTYKDQGTIAFKYRNDDAEAINGFSFKVDPAWIDSTDIGLAFGLYSSTTNNLITGTDNFSSSPNFVSLKDFVKLQPSLFSVSHAYSAEVGKEIVQVKFTNPDKLRYLSFAFQFKRYGTSPRSIADLSINKKVAVKIPKAAGTTVTLPIQGWVDDPTATEIKIQETTVKLEQGGYFSLPYQLNSTQSETTINLSCFNAAGEHVTLTFTAAIFNSESKIKNVVFSDDNGPLQENSTASYEFGTSKSQISVDAKLFGLEGLIVGYESYAYVFVDGKETLKKLGSAVFDPKFDESLSSEYLSYGPGYTSGQLVANDPSHYKPATIPLYPGKQRVIVYVENPGGQRSEFKISDGTSDYYPDIVYNLPNNEQKIVLLNPDIVPLTATPIVGSVTVDKQIDVSVHETTTAPYVFKRTFTANGRINSLFKFNDLKVKSTDGAVVFSNGTGEITVAVDDLNRFQVDAFITMPENLDSAQYPLLFIPTAPFLDAMKTGLMINAQKDYKNTFIVPDFSLMAAGNWTPTEKTDFEKVLRVKIDRHVPTNTSLAVSVNYASPITGTLVAEGSGTKVYRLLDENRAEVKLSGIKNGQNRLRWELSRNDTIASSISGRQGMTDYMLEIDFSSTGAATVVDFPVDPKSYYDGDSDDANGARSLPVVTVTKQPTTDVKVYLNGVLVATDTQAKSVYTVDLKTFPIVQGKNTVDLTYLEKSGATNTLSYTFLYDTAVPVVQFLDSTYGTDGTGKYLKTFRITVKEANLQKIELIQKVSGLDSNVPAHYELQAIGDQTAQVGWLDFSTLPQPLRPNATSKLYVRATDYTGKFGLSELFSGVDQLPAGAIPSPVPIRIGNQFYNNSPIFEDEATRWGNGPFAKRLKIFNANIELHDLAIPDLSAQGDVYQIQRAGSVVLDPVLGLTGNKTLKIFASNSVTLGKGFSVPSGTQLVIPRPSTNTRVNSPMLRFTQAQNLTNAGLSLSFWFRNEGEPFYANDPNASQPNNFRKILTIAQGNFDNDASPAIKVDYELYLAYKDTDYSVNGDETLYLVEWRGLRTGTPGVWTNQEYHVIMGGDSVPLALNKGGQNGWNLITLAIKPGTTNAGGTAIFDLSVNNQEPQELVHWDVYRAGNPRFISHWDNNFNSNLDAATFVQSVGFGWLDQSQQVVQPGILSAGAPFYFGNQNGTDGNFTSPIANGSPDLTNNNGHYSLAQPFYVTRPITNADVTAMASTIKSAFIAVSESTTVDWNPQMATATYPFDKSVDTGDVSGVAVAPSTSTLLLKASGSVDKYFSGLENARYTETNDSSTIHGSFVAAAQQQNRLKVSGDGVIFQDASNWVTDKISVGAPAAGGADSSDWFQLTPTSTDFPGRYSFANNFGSHAVMNNRWYSIYGSAKPATVNGSIDASLVLVINGVEKRYKIDSGDFHFVFSNEANSLPSSVVMYMETKKPLLLAKKMFFTEGNYRLPNEAFGGLVQSNAKTTYIFQPTGSIDFWYKPLSADKDGFVDYSGVLVDSEYFRIDTVSTANSHAVYRATLGMTQIQGMSNVVLTSQSLVRAGWQHIQLSWDVVAKVAYLYVDGGLVGKAELPSASGQLFPWSPSMVGVYPASDNLVYGSDLNGSVFANGYLDDIHLDNWYSQAKFQDREPIKVSYSDNFGETDVPDPKLTISLANGVAASAFSNLTVTLYNDEGKAVYRTDNEAVDSIGLNIANYTAGQYRLVIKALVNGYRFEKVTSFVKDDRPKIILRSNTSLIVASEPTNLKFNFGYFTSHLLATDSPKYAGVELTVTGALGATRSTQKYYVVQDFVGFNHDHPENWRLYRDETADLSTPFVMTNNEFTITLPNYRSIEAVDWSYRPFYFSNSFTFGNPPPVSVTTDGTGSIPLASLQIDRKSAQIGSATYEYKLGLTLGTKGFSATDTVTDFGVVYSATSRTTGQSNSLQNAVHFDGDGKTDLYYDDMLKDLGYGSFDSVVSLLYKGVVIASYPVVLDREQVVAQETLVVEKHLAITEFALLQINKTTTGDFGQFYLAYDQDGFLNTSSGSTSELYYEVKILKVGATGGYEELYSRAPTKANPTQTHAFAIIQDVPLNGTDLLVRINLYEKIGAGASATIGLVSKQDLTVANRSNPPEVVFTNSVSSRIAYNNVHFTWIGYQDGAFKPEIRYAYNFDNKGWSSISASWRGVDFYNLTEGYHTLIVRAYYGDGDRNVSPDAVATFFVDFNRPVIDTTKIRVSKIYDDAGFLYAVNLVGDLGAIQDASLDSVTINDTAVPFNADGSFVVNKLPIAIDGDNPIKISAIDSVGNFKDATIVVANALTEVLFPQVANVVRFAPATVVGRLPAKINSTINIYLKDAQTPSSAAGDYTGWKKARVNEDFTFFVEDVAVYPGTAVRQAHTPLTMAVVTDTGHVYQRTIDVFANELIRPIDLNLSTHAIAGQQSQTQVVIEAQAKVNNISSWSIDFTGDGIYDDVVIMDNPATAQTYTWQHAYSSLGLVKPRVRVITRDGNYFSVNDELIIHEAIREASNKAVDSPLAMSTLTMDDKSQRLYVLAGKNGSYRVEVYQIGRNDSFISNKMYQVVLNGFGIENPVKVLALDAKTLVIAENKNGLGVLYTLRADEFDAYNLVGTSTVSLNDTVADIDADTAHLFVTLTNSNNILTIEVADGLAKPASLTFNDTQILNERNLGGKLGIAKDSYGILVADYFNQRLVRLSDSFKNLEYQGSQGSGEGEFIKPTTIKSYQNRLVVYDEGRHDIQIFDPDFKPITTLNYNASLTSGNYLDATFLQNVVGVSVFARQESNRLFYYATLLSNSSNKLAVLRLPQWEEMRATVRNNKIIFLKDGEVYLAKPNGSDLARLISSDSIPRINGSVDYPTLSPDGKRLAFTSRAKLFDGSGLSTAGTTYAYDNLYYMNTDGTDLTRIPLGTYQGYEIERPQFNSNGTTLIFSAKPTGGHWQIYVYSFDTGGVERLFVSDENARFPYYSPDDRFVVFDTDYDGDEDLQIFDTQNPSVRVAVTNNRARDSYPVWSVVYPGEIANPDLKIESKIAFVSDRTFHKGIYYVYLSRPSEGDLRVVKKTGEQVGNQPDQAAIELTSSGNEGDYPAFTGDGTAVVYEHFDGSNDNLLRHDFAANSAVPVGLADGSRRPAGMKNTIAQFKSEVVNGNDVHLTWSRYTDTDIFYTVRFKVNRDNQPFVEKRVFTQGETVLTGLDMGVEYLFQVSINEDGQDAATTQWTKLLIPEVAARPSYEIDKVNPYLVHLKAWKPKPDTDWGFSWIIDNQEIQVQSSTDYLYEFGTSGTKTISLKAHNKANTVVSVSAPLMVKIVSDIQPFIEKVLGGDSGSWSYIDLSAQKSLGASIDWSTAVWTITGPGLGTPKQLLGSRGIVNIADFKNKINVNLKLSRIHVNGQVATDTLESNLVVDLDYRGTKLVVTQTADEANERLLTFSGANSIGNVNWREAHWTIFRDGQALYQTNGVSSFAYEFPETGVDARYSVSLSVPQLSDGQTATVSNIVTIGAAPIDPVIDYQVTELKNASGAVTGAKVIFSAGNSKGSNIDFAQAKWTVPVAGTYNEQPTQNGPTAVYNLFNVGSITQVDVSLTLMRRGGIESKTVTKTIAVRAGDIARPQLIVNRRLQATTVGKSLALDVLSSTGPNIDWEKTTWQFSASTTMTGQNLNQTGPTARLDIPASADTMTLAYTTTLYLIGSNQPLVERAELRSEDLGLRPAVIRPVISPKQEPGGTGNVYTLSVTDTTGVNIDWERTSWSIYDGHDSVVQKFGAQITHAFVRKDKQMGYPVVVAMYLKNSSTPFYGYQSIDIDGDPLMPVIGWDKADAASASEILFTADKSTGSGIDWSQAKWTFGDGSPSQYGSAVGHKYAYSTADATYKVSLTLTRRLSNGDSETSTRYSTVTVGKDEIKPVITATYDSNTGTLVLSAADSEGRGLLLDRSIWAFNSKGTSETVVAASHMDWNLNTEVSVGLGVGIPELAWNRFGITFDANFGQKDTGEIVYSNDNFHQGVMVRRIFRVDYGLTTGSLANKKISVALAVYRQDADGKLVGKTITVNIDLTDGTRTYR